MNEHDGNPTVAQINRSFRKFSDYSDDLLRADMNTFEDRVRFLMSYCETDAVFSFIHDQLIQSDNSKYEEWLKERKSTVKGMVGSGDLVFPQDEDTRIATMYWLLRKVGSDELDASDFANDFYATRNNSINEYLQFFSDAVVAPLKRDLEYRFEEMMEKLPSGPSERIPTASIQIIHSATNVIQQSAHGSNIDQSAKVEIGADLHNLFAQLRDEITRASEDEQTKIELLSIATDAEELVAMDPPKKSAARRLLSLLPPLGNLGSIVGGIVSAIGT